MSKSKIQVDMDLWPRLRIQAERSGVVGMRLTDARTGRMGLLEAMLLMVEDLVGVNRRLEDRLTDVGSGSLVAEAEEACEFTDTLHIPVSSTTSVEDAQVLGLTPGQLEVEDDDND